MSRRPFNGECLQMESESQPRRFPRPIGGGNVSTPHVVPTREGYDRYTHSDVDLYAISTVAFQEHWFMERVAGRRVELTVYSFSA
jgi:hypothetical protein